jgi:glutathionyl-hydroquinone reductase
MSSSSTTTAAATAGSTSSGGNETKGSWTTSISKKGEFQRKESQFRSKIENDSKAEFPAEAGH